MQTYQNFYSQMSNYGQMMPNPYMDRMAQLQQYQQNLQPAQIPVTYPQQPQGIIGRAVNDFSEITANDVPMDGRSAIFPKNDMSEIQVRTWGNDGKIITTSYKPILEHQNQMADISILESEKLKIGLSDDVTDAFMKRFDDIEKRLDEFVTKTAAKTSTSRVKKEADAE